MQTSNVLAGQVLAVGLSPALAAVIGLLLLGGLVGGVLLLRRQARLTSTPRVQIEPDSAGRPRAEERLTVDAPVAISEGMSLKEIKQAKSARLSGAVDAHELLRQERERRRTTVVAGSVTGPASAPETKAEAADAGGDLGEETQEQGVRDAVDDTTPDAGATLGEEVAPASAGAVPAVPAASVPAQGRSMAEGLARTRGGFIARLGALFQEQQTIDDALLEEMEEVLFTADIGAKTAAHLLQVVTEAVEELDAPTGADVWRILRQEMARILTSNARRMERPDGQTPWVILMVGVNGAGKTTTIGKLASRWTAQGQSVLMVAGDTFRAAAVGQLEEWSRRVGCGFHRGADESDPSGVIFEGIRRAVDEGIDIVLVDTAGRLQTKKPLMDELQKIMRTAGKALDGAPHETILVLDANTGQNGIQQARLFSEAAGLTGLVLTKLDGTAKGGVALGVNQELGVPVYFVGIGEAPEDLREFNAQEFVDALF